MVVPPAAHFTVSRRCGLRPPLGGVGAVLYAFTASVTACSAVIAAQPPSRSSSVAADSGPAISLSAGRGVPASRWAVSQVARARRRDRAVSPMRMRLAARAAEFRSCGTMNRAHHPGRWWASASAWRVAADRAGYRLGRGPCHAWLGFRSFLSRNAFRAARTLPYASEDIFMPENVPEIRKRRAKSFQA